ncbi:MAG: hypothetical protein JWP75_3465, partial [Frondihabitans sp.]|nr:hypothetical protein [Frondihabitans sp.]
MSYYRSLAAYLRGQRLREKEIRTIVRDVREHCEASGENPRGAFGSPDDYAKLFPRSRAIPSLGRIVSTAGGLMVGTLIVEVGRRSLT